MFRKLVAAAGFAISLAALSSAAEAKTSIAIGVGLGAPSAGYGYSPYDGSYGYREPVFLRNYLSCPEAAFKLSQNGWRNVRARNCHGSTYVFTGVRGRVPGILRINGLTGRVVSVRWLR